MDENIINLIHQEVDGCNSAAERKRLQKLCSQDPEAAKLLKELEATSHALESLGYIAPPVSLETDILRAIDSNKYAFKKNPFGVFFERIKEFSKARYPLPAFAAGVITGAIILFLLRFPAHVAQQDEYSQFQGTLSHENLKQAATQNYIISTGLNDVCGQLELQDTDRYAVVKLHLQSSDPLEIILTSDAGDLQFKSINLEKTDVSPEFNIDANNLKLMHSGEQIY
ncbi:hypothetical protein JW935_15555, partial [candidate division KSB1 bacterium]|nr:hypothetical protein [candidate division KSB1 bacterium]